MRCFVLALGACLAVSCQASLTATLEKPAEVPLPAGGLWPHDDPRVHAWTSSAWSFSTTSYAIEGDDGLVLIDTQFLTSETIAFVNAVEASTGKPARVAVVLHANPDKFNGTATLQARGIRVVTSSAVAALIPGVHEQRLRAFGPRYAPDYPTDLPEPEALPERETIIDDVAGVTLRLLATGAGCSAAHVVAVVDTDRGRHLFAGDLIANGSHSWLELGLMEAWRARLYELETLQPHFVHHGRGRSGGVALIVAQRHYLDDVTAIVAGTDAGRTDAVATAKAAIIKRYPTLRFPVFLNIGLPALLRPDE